MRWSAFATASADDEPPPSARSGHSATLVGGYVVVFGGTQGKSFRADTVVLDARAPSDVKRARWFRPTPAATGGPGPRAFHSAVAVGTDLYVLCGRTGREQHGDVWVLDTTTWRWSALADRFPSAKRVGVTPRDFGVAARVPNGNNVLLFGGFDGHGWLNDLQVLDVATGEWRAVAVSVAPSPRSGHAGDVVDSRVLLFGGQASNGQLCGDLWALRDPDTDPIARDADALVDILDGRGDASSGSRPGADGRRSAEADADASPARDESAEESSREPRWTRLHLRGQPPGPRTGHSVTCVGNKVLVFGGRGDDGWLVKQHVYYDDAHVVDRELGKWRRLERVAGSNQRPSPRAFHTMTKVGDVLLLLGGFSGETALGDAWWCEFGEEDAAAETERAAAAAERLKHPGAAAHSPLPAASLFGSPPAVLPPGVPGGLSVAGNVAGGVGRLLMSGLGAVGTAARGVGTAAGVGAADPADPSTTLGARESAPGVERKGASVSPPRLDERQTRQRKERLLASLLRSLERKSAEDESYPDVGEEGRRHFFASCDPGDLRVGDVRDALAAYRRAVPAQGLGMPPGIPGMRDDGEENVHRTPSRGRFMHFSPENVRIGDVPAMLAELQGALIAEAQ